MNPIIKQLAEEHFVRDEYTEFGWQSHHRYEFEPDELEAFVADIVKSCALVVDRPVLETIKRHFGVES